MRLQVLGSNSKGNCYVIEHNDEYLIIEAGINDKEVIQAIDYRLDKVVGVLVSHEHKDHSKYLKRLSDRGLKVFANSDTLKSSNITNLNATPLESGDYVAISNNISVLTFKLFHDVDNLGFLIKVKDWGNILFETDTYKSPYAFKKVRLFMKEANYQEELLLETQSFYRDRVIKSHMEIETTIKTLKQSIDSSSEHIVLLHLSGGHSDSNYFKKRVVEETGIPTTIATKGLVLEL